MRSISHCQACRAVSKLSSPLVGQGGQKLDREKRIAAGLLMHEPSQRLGTGRGALESIAGELPDIGEPEGDQNDLLHPRADLADRLQRPRQGMLGADLVVPVGPDQQQMPDLGIRRQMLDEIEGRRIQPLQIVQEERQRMLFAGEHAEEAREDHMKSTLSILRRQIGDRRLIADHQLEIGDEVDDELAVRTHRLA